jgi:hypothetical protein
MDASDADEMPLSSAKQPERFNVLLPLPSHSPEAVAQALQPYLLQGIIPVPDLIAYTPWAHPPSLLAYYASSNGDPFAVLDRLEQEGLLLEVVYSVSPSGPLFVSERHPDIPGPTAYFRLLVLRGADEAQAFVEGRARTPHPAWSVQPITERPSLGDDARWFRCDPPSGMSATQFGRDWQDHGHHVRWRRGLLAFDLRMGMPQVDLPGFVALAQQLDAVQALKLPLRLHSQIPAPATERERLAALLRLDRLLNDSALDHVAKRVSLKYAPIDTPSPAQVVLDAVEHARELHRLDVGWQRVAALKVGFVGPSRTILTAEAIVDATAEAARRDLQAPPQDVWDTQQVLPNALTLGDQTVTMRLTHRRPDSWEWQEESVAWTHGPVKLIAHASGFTHQADWSLLSAFALALEEAYQSNVSNPSTGSVVS